MAISGIARKTKVRNTCRTDGAITAQEALAIGINWYSAPVVDINNNPDNPVINVRRLGTPDEVIYLASAFLRC